MSTTFDSTNRSLHEFLNDLHSGKLKQPDFQGGWVWDAPHTREGITEWHQRIW